jgi:hypothetical protein
MDDFLKNFLTVVNTSDSAMRVGGREYQQEPVAQVFQLFFTRFVKFLR